MGLQREKGEAGHTPARSGFGEGRLEMPHLRRGLDNRRRGGLRNHQPCEKRSADQRNTQHIEASSWFQLNGIDSEITDRFGQPGEGIVLHTRIGRVHLPQHPRMQIAVCQGQVQHGDSGCNTTRERR